MLRRTALAAIGSALAGAAGCLGGGSRRPTPPSTSTASPATGTSTPDPSTAPPTDETPLTAETTIADTAFRRRERCGAPGDARVSIDGDAVVVRGCIRGANGCTVPKLAAVSLDTATGELTVLVATEERGGADRACTQAIVDLGYEVEVTFRGRPPARVDVVHDGGGGRGTVAQYTPRD
jgi:hypothetical protein